MGGAEPADCGFALGRVTYIPRGELALPLANLIESRGLGYPNTLESRAQTLLLKREYFRQEVELLKAKLAREIRAIIKRRRLTQAKSAQLLGMKQPDVSAIVTGRTGKFSIDRLVRCLGRLDYKVDVVVRHKPRKSVRTAGLNYLQKLGVQLSIRSPSSEISISSSSWPISVETSPAPWAAPSRPKRISRSRSRAARLHFPRCLKGDLVGVSPRSTWRSVSVPSTVRRRGAGRSR
ncbi:helix-turn-helix domain-containing protein [Mesorhizobium sp. Cs1321R2N1]|uniref:helix-turn-helix domain-containing protein n=1 Tax=Mesorhizobium sp. Cs1321R2N1 TaxID=3015174 RepID=UPI00301CD3EF